MSELTASGKHTPKHSSQTSQATRPSSKRGGASRHLARLVFLLGAFLLALVVWLSRTWAQLSSDEIIFHLRASLSGTDMSLVKRFCLHYVPLICAACALDYWLLALASARGDRMRTIGTTATFLLGAAMIAGAFWTFGQMVDIEAFLPSNGEDFVGEHYVDPAETEIGFPEEKRNLVYIYLESMELTYADEDNGGAWSENLIPELTELAHEGETFNGGEGTLEGALVLPGCTWTMGGMFAQSAGVPLKVPTHGNRTGLAMEGFFNDLTCLGDILADQGYQQYVLFGSDADFGNRREYYTEHRDFDIFDYNRALEERFIPEGYKVFWGFEDEKLFEKARQTLTEAATSSQPFNLTMLTVDTHFEDGYVCHLCGTEHGDDQYANVMSCSSRQVSEFVHWIQSQDFYENTTIVLCGDHTTMDKDFCDNVPDSYQRRTFTTIINGAAEPSSNGRRQYATIDLFPTTLAALGCSFDGDRLGLGTNLYSGTQTVVEEYGLNKVSKAFGRQSEFLNSYSNVLTGSELVDSILSQIDITLDYKKTKRLSTTGFRLREIHHLSVEVIESARLELTDTRTGETKNYAMDIYRPNENWGAKYTLLARVNLPEDEVPYYTAEAYVTVTGDGERLYASWNGAEDYDSEGDDGESEEVQDTLQEEGN